MFAYSEEDLISDASIMTSTCSTDNFGLLAPDHSSTTSQGDNVSDSNIVINLVQQHSECVRFLAFADSTLRAESGKSSQYNMVMRTKPALQTNSDREGNASRKGQQQKLGEYHNRDLNDIIAELPISLDVSEINSSATGRIFNSSASSVKVSLKQLRKDVERDRFIINGVPLLGSEKGLEGVSSAITECCIRALAQCCLQPMEKGVEDLIAVEVLSKASRTNSGGIAYQCLHYLIKPTTINIVPVSTLAKPLNINISVGSFVDSKASGNGQHNNWGLICRVDCSTFFTLKSNEETTDSIDQSENSDDPTVQIIFDDSICVPVNPCKKFSIQNLAGITGTNANSGRVTVCKLVPLDTIV
jgi:hypothetical protein